MLIIMRNSLVANDKPNQAESDLSVYGLPGPEEGLAATLSKLIPPSALTFSTRFARVPVTMPPAVSSDERDRHVSRAHAVWRAGWDAHEERRSNSSLDDRVTPGGRYEAIASAHPWLTLAMERAGLSWEQALVLAEAITRPGLDWFELEQATVNGSGLVPRAGMPRLTFDTSRPREKSRLRPLRDVSLAVLHDVGDETATTGMLLEAYPEDRHRQPSRLVWAGVLCDVTRPSTSSPPFGAAPEVGAGKALGRGRRLLAALGAWPWCRRPHGQLEAAWWTADDVGSALRDWTRVCEARESVARSRRRAAQDAAWDRIPSQM